MLRYGNALRYTYQAANQHAVLYPHDSSHPAMQSGRVRGFISAYAWLQAMRSVDLNLGSRIHGCIAGVLSGAPTLALTLDTRMEELCRYHCIPFIPAAQVDAHADVRSLCESVDFNSVQRGHEERFRHFVSFLNANGLQNIYQDDLDVSESVLDRTLAKAPEWEGGTITSSAHVPAARHLKGMMLNAGQELAALRKRYLKP